jgi:four helix bundle protein
MRFEDLALWKRACRLCVEVFKALKVCRDSGFKDQITRSALSIPSNIAEGYERSTNKDATKFFYYAKGSAGELPTQTYIGIEIGYIHKQTGLNWMQEAEEISKMLSGLIKARTL